MKRSAGIIIASTLLMSTVFMASCSKEAAESSSTVLGDSRQTQESETTIAPQDRTVTYSEIKGTFSGSSYINNNSALTVTTPEGWTHLGEDETAEYWGSTDLIRKSDDVLAFNDVAYESVWKATNGDNMSIMLMYAPGASEADYGAVLNTDDFENVTLGNKEVAVNYSSYIVDDTEIQMARIINYNNDTMTVITINCLTSEDIENVMANIEFN